jgi:hypothetical protein
MFTMAVAALALLGFPFGPGSDLRPNEMIVGGGSCEADGLWVTSPSLYLRRGCPGVAVGMVRLPGEARRYAYVLLIKGDPRRKVFADYGSRSELTGSGAGSRGFVEIAGKKVAFAYKVEVDPAGKQAARETLWINGRALDVGKGRVVLVDLSADGVRWQQVGAGVPRSPSWPTETAGVESQVKALVGYLRRGDREVRRFLE